MNTYKMLANYDFLYVDKTYRTTHWPKWTMFTDVDTGREVSLYHWQVEHALLTGKMKEVDAAEAPPGGLYE